jgi:hypothetical protein
MNKLLHTEGRIIVEINLERKNSHMFEDGTKIRLERRFDCFDMKYTQPVNATVVSAEHIPEGSEVIIHHNCVHETNRVYDYKPLSGADIASDVRYFSILETEAFVWYDGSDWCPLPGFDLALRVFKPYNGAIQGIEPTLLKDILWITTGEYEDQAVITLKCCDYQLIFQDVNGREKNIIRLRTSENEKEQRESEVIALHHGYTEQILNGELHVGLTKTDAKQLKDIQYA